MLKPSLQIKLGQTLTMTPQLQQAIRMLQLPMLDLSAQIQDALEKNVMLEIEDLPEIPKTAGEAASELDTPEAANNKNIHTNQSIGDAKWGSDTAINTEFEDRNSQTLHQHLLWQIATEDFTPEEEMIGTAIVDAINDDGYLIADLEEIKEFLSKHSDIGNPEIEAVLAKVQRLDPVGIGARSLSECITLQLSQLESSTSGLDLAIQIATDHLSLVAGQKFDDIRRSLRTSEELFELALALVKSCNPKPGQSVSLPPAEYVIPDVFVHKVDDRWLVELSAEGIPRLSVNQRYANLLQGNSDHAVLRTQLQEARWLVRSLEIRNETLLKVANSIVSRQHEFLDHGDESMKPLILRNIAESIGMHESTISRVTSNKYMHTPRGIFEFKFFFSSHLSTDLGEDQSSISVRAKIRKLIGAENVEKPLSDNKITALLAKEGITIARRTVAKYREGMRIPSSSERKVMKRS